jgi:hypothetical protein
MTEPSDTDRIIAAQRQEAHKTRVLLAWIFIGIPAIGAIIWGIVALVDVASRSGIGGGTATTEVTPVTSAVLPGISDTTPCSAVNAGVSDNALSNYVGSDLALGSAFQDECGDNPTWSAARALAKAKQDFVAPTS